VPSWLHLALLTTHIGAGIAAILLGAAAVVVRKGGSTHAWAGTAFFVAMLVLGLSASVLEPFRTPKPGSPFVGVFVCYFVLTSWVAARRRDGTAGWFEKCAAVVALGTGALIVSAGLGGSTPTPGSRAPVFFLGGLCLLAGLLDLRVVLRKRLTAGERIRRHLWRMCFAFFIATGSFFLGQQKVMPVAVRGSPILFVLAFAPFVVMAFWLVRLRFPKFVGRLSLRLPPAPAHVSNHMKVEI
jgi:hypothetical protein